MAEGEEGGHRRTHHVSIGCSHIVSSCRLKRPLARAPCVSVVDLSVGGRGYGKGGEAHFPSMWGQQGTGIQGTLSYREGRKRKRREVRHPGQPHGPTLSHPPSTLGKARRKKKREGTREETLKAVANCNLAGDEMFCFRGMGSRLVLHYVVQ